MINHTAYRIDRQLARGTDTPTGAGGERAVLEHFAARKAAKHAAAVISAMRDALIVVDEHGAVADVNGAFCAMTGLGRHELIGNRGYPFWSRTDRDANAAAIDRVLSRTEAGAAQIELVITRRSGDRIRVSASVAPLRDRDGEAIGYVATLRELERAPQAVSPATPVGSDEPALIDALARAVEEPSFEVAFARVAESAANAVQCDAAMIVRVEDDAATRVGHWSTGRYEDLEHVVEPGSAVHVLADGGMRIEGGPDHTFASVVGVPILLGGRPWGALYVARLTGNGPLPADVVETLARFVTTATLALIAVDARRPSERRGAHDPLTGMDDRAALDERLVAELSRARRHGRDLSLVVIEVDNLATIETELGEEGRDRVLAGVAGIMRRLIRAGDAVARIRAGGFAWLLPETDSRSALLAAERAQTLLGTIRLSKDESLTVSCGIADALDAEHDAGELFRQAELALHQAGATGGNVIARFGLTDPQVWAQGFGANARRQTLASLRLVARVMDTSGGQNACASGAIADLAERTALRLGWTPCDARLLHEATLIRDIGMLGIPEQIRSKSHGHSAAERRKLHSHPGLSAELVSQVLTEPQVAWIRHHHERFDGAGYPAGLGGTQIPEGALIIAAAEAWVDLVTEMKGRTSLREIAGQIRAEAGWQFCPRVVAALVDAARDRPASTSPAEIPAPAPEMALAGHGLDAT